MLTILEKKKVWAGLRKAEAETRSAKQKAVFSAFFICFLLLPKQQAEAEIKAEAESRN